MWIISRILELVTSYWFVVIPELIYVMFAGFLHFGPGGVLGALIYLAALLVSPKAVMFVTGIVIAVHIAVMIGKDLIADNIAKSKEAGLDNGENGVPKLSGHDKEVQDALDKMKEKEQGEEE